MLTILIAVQAVVPKNRLGVATSLSMFSRSIGGAIGVALMGAVLAVSLAERLSALGATIDPNQLLDPHARDQIAPATLALLESALADSLRGAFWIGVGVAILAFVAAFWLPRKLGHPPAPVETPFEG
jgi:hypothetical protein